MNRHYKLQCYDARDIVEVGYHRAARFDDPNDFTGFFAQIWFAGARRAADKVLGTEGELFQVPDLVAATRTIVDWTAQHNIRVAIRLQNDALTEAIGRTNLPPDTGLLLADNLGLSA